MISLSFVLKALTASVVCAAIPVSAQIQQAWVAKYNNGISNANHQGLKMALDSGGNIYVLGVSANANTNTGYAVVKYAPNGNRIWASRYDSTNYPSATPAGFVLDTSNAVVVTGSAVTVKYDADGNLLWTAPYNAQALAIDAGQNAYLTGVASNFTTMKLNPQGSNIWSQTWTVRSPNMAQIIALDSSNNVYVSGGESVPGSVTAYPRVVALKYNMNGVQLWETDIVQGDYGPQVTGLAIDGLGITYIECNFAVGLGDESGYITSKLNSDGSMAWQAYDPTANGNSLASDLVLDSMGSVIVTGQNAHYPPLPSYGTYKLDTNGSYVWTNVYPMSSYGPSGASAIALDSAINVYVTGSSTVTNTGSDIATIKYDSNGNQIWLQRYDGPGHGNDAGNAISVDNSGNVYVAGYETETNGFTSMILIKYSPVSGQKQSNGNFILHAYGSPGESFDLQASTNLQTWQDLGSVIADTNGVALFEDTNAPLFPTRFYYTVPQ